ncbi:MAG: carbonic anhydrase [Bacteriovorax sp.]|nr:carbonic anhydrase [Bacteriovorax sp.]
MPSKFSLLGIYLCLMLLNAAFAKDGHVDTKSSNHTATQEKHDEHKREAGPVEADKSLGFLKNGNTRFMKAHVRKDGASKSDRERLSSGQKPHAIVLSCSDSRVPPEIVFDQKLGEIFVVRTAGQSLDASAIASIEYAVSHLGSNLIVVMGHESCGAVKAALGTLKGGDAGSPWLNKLVADLHPHLKRYSETPPSQGVLAESWSNVEGVALDLIEQSEIIKKLVQSGEVKIQNALYHLDSGSVEWR